MNYGFLLKNKSDEIQVDCSYENYMFHEQSTFNYISNGDGWQLVSFGASDSRPIIAVKATENNKALGTFKKDSSDRYHQALLWVSANENCQYVAFRKTKPSDINIGYGLVVYNDSGGIVFHSNARWCRIIAVNVVNNPLGTDCSSSINTDVTVVDADNNYFYLTPVYEVAQYNPHQGISMFASPTFRKINSTTIRIERKTTGGTSGIYQHCHTGQYINLIEFKLD